MTWPVDGGGAAICTLLPMQHLCRVGATAQRRFVCRSKGPPETVGFLLPKSPLFALAGGPVNPQVCAVNA